jgi:hypothetical protein
MRRHWGRDQVHRRRDFVSLSGLPIVVLKLEVNPAWAER